MQNKRYYVGILCLFMQLSCVNAETTSPIIKNHAIEKKESIEQRDAGNVQSSPVADSKKAQGEKNTVLANVVVTAGIAACVGWCVYVLKRHNGRRQHLDNPFAG